MNKLVDYVQHKPECRWRSCSVCGWSAGERKRHAKIGYGDHAVLRRECNCGLAALLADLVTEEHE